MTNPYADILKRVIDLHSDIAEVSNEIEAEVDTFLGELDKITNDLEDLKTKHAVKTTGIISWDRLTNGCHYWVKSNYKRVCYTKLTKGRTFNHNDGGVHTLNHPIIMDIVAYQEPGRLIETGGCVSVSELRMP